MNQIEQAVNPVKVLVAPRSGAKISQTSLRAKGNSLTDMLRMARDTARAEDFVWGILAASTLIIILVSVWI